VYSFNTNTLTPKIYYSQIIANTSGVDLEIVDLFIRILPVVYDIELDISSNNYVISPSGDNLLTITISDISHGVRVNGTTIMCNIDGVNGTIFFVEDGVYTLDLNQFGLNPAINPYSLNIYIANPYGEDKSINITVVYPRDLNVLWWIAGAVGGTVLLGSMSLFIYFRYVKQTRFQRDVAFIKKNITNLNKIKSRSEPSRDKIVSDIINKEIDQLL
jgi:hypothetical protein